MILFQKFKNKKHMKNKQKTHEKKSERTARRDARKVASTLWVEAASKPRGGDNPLRQAKRNESLPKAASKPRSGDNPLRQAKRNESLHNKQQTIILNTYISIRKKYAFADHG